MSLGWSLVNGWSATIALYYLLDLFGLVWNLFGLVWNLFGLVREAREAREARSGFPNKSVYAGLKMDKNTSTDHKYT